VGELEKWEYKRLGGKWQDRRLGWKGRDIKQQKMLITN
jgi:hypothetical protein